jgi:hypothetical protein
MKSPVSTGIPMVGEFTVPAENNGTSRKLLDISMEVMLVGNSAELPENGEEDRDAAGMPLIFKLEAFKLPLDIK